MIAVTFITPVTINGHPLIDRIVRDSDEWVEEIRTDEAGVAVETKTGGTFFYPWHRIDYAWVE